MCSPSWAWARFAAAIAVSVYCVVSAEARLVAAETPKVFRAGAAIADITPPQLPISINGGMQDRQATEVHDPLQARCLVLDDGDTKLAIVVCDSCMIPREVFDAAKQAARDTGIAVEHMLMSATHAHSAATSAGVFQSEPSEAYTRFLAERVADGVRKAALNLEPARVGWGVAEDRTQVFNRRWLTKPGVNTDPFGHKTDRVRMNPGHRNPDITGPAGPVDSGISLVAVESLEGRPIAVLANYSLHYVGGVPGDMLSADYFAEFAAKLSQLVNATTSDQRPFVVIMSNGTSGNINNVDYSQPASPAREPFEQISVVAASVATAALKAYRDIEFRDWAQIAMRETEVELGVRLPSEDDVAEARRILADAGPGPYANVREIYARETVLLSEYPQTVKAKLQAIRIGDLGIVSSPCETFVETGLAIKEQSPLSPTFVIELANGYNGYLPTPEHHALGGYETWRARSSYLVPEAETTIRRRLLDLLSEVAKGKGAR